jgi:hypothetical protein
MLQSLFNARYAFYLHQSNIFFLNFPESVPSAKPSRLLPTEELKIYPRTLPEEIFNTISLDEHGAFYVLKLSTSREFNSSLVDKNSAILVCFIDVVGDSLLQRVPAIYSDQSSKGIKAEQSIPFQSGSVDVVVFKGHKLQRIKEIWIGLESGILHAQIYVHCKHIFSVHSAVRILFLLLFYP